ncbi:uncharacterized protein LOC128295610 [Gossypium arboreum]|uniref:uncharacterized protein LOC128295610 n=1 Tax=Gossypium arboreum TaxID=29729 RepID=UPI0022F1626E|nr:uncharacterized protein LOC128295610 [Gossypium arboreum]
MQFIHCYHSNAPSKGLALFFFLFIILLCVFRSWKSLPTSQVFEIWLSSNFHGEVLVMLFHSFLELSLSTNSVLREKEKKKPFASTPWKLKKAVGKHDGNSGLGFSNKRRKKNALFLFICKQTMVNKIRMLTTSGNDEFN